MHTKYIHIRCNRINQFQKVEIQEGWEFVLFIFFFFPGFCCHSYPHFNHKLYWIIELAEWPGPIDSIEIWDEKKNNKYKVSFFSERTNIKKRFNPHSNGSGSLLDHNSFNLALDSIRVVQLFSVSSISIHFIPFLIYRISQIIYLCVFYSPPAFASFVDVFFSSSSRYLFSCIHIHFFSPFFSSLWFRAGASATVREPNIRHIHIHIHICTY